MSEFTKVKEDIAKIKIGMNGLEVKVQLTYNNTVDMPGLADKVNILVASHATLFTFLQDIHDAKRGEMEHKKEYVASYRPIERTPNPATPLALTQRELAIKEIFEEVAPISEQEYLEAQKNKWPGYKVPT